MKILFLEGNAQHFDQNSIWDSDENKKMKKLFRFDNYKQALDWIIQSLNDEDLDVTNNFHSYRVIDE